MKIALLGYGKMGKAIEEIAQYRGHDIVLKVTSAEPFSLQDVDLAIDFSAPISAVRHISSCLEAGVPVISGTTGWLDNYEDMTRLCKEQGGTFLYASNFSIGVNIFFEINKKLANLMSNQEGYQVVMEEIHHTQKLDAPSGTAITLAEGIVRTGEYKDWSLEKGGSTINSDSIPITSLREGTVPGTHTVTYNSTIDSIQIKHEAHSREGFAQGAVIAAEWLYGKKGVFSMKDVLNIS